MENCFISNDVQPLFGNDVFEVFQSIVECMYCGIIISKNDSKFVIWNSQAKKILGKVDANIPVDEWATYYGMYNSENDIEEISSSELPLVKAIDGKSVNNQKLFVRNEGQTGIWINCTAKPIRSSNGEIIGGVVVFEDITKNKLLEKDKLALLDVITNLTQSKRSVLEKLETVVS